jgi:hypothetical protein
VLTNRCDGCTVSGVAEDERPVEQVREENRHAAFLEAFRGRLETRLRRERRGQRAYDWPYVEARPIEYPLDDRLAEFAAGVLIAPTPRSSPEPWQVRGVLYRNPRGPAVVGDLLVEHFPATRRAVRAEVTGTVLRGLPLGEIRDEALAGLRGRLEAREAMLAGGTFGMTEEQVLPARRAVTEATKPKPGRPGLPEEHYRRIALRYLALLKHHRNVLVALAAEESERQGRIVPRETVRDWVRKATGLGYLAPGKPGRAEARPGPKLKRKEK